MAHSLWSVCKKAGQFVLLALMVTFATFLLSSLIPGDFYTARQLEPTVRRETVERLRQDFSLDQPVHKQYIRWLRQAARLDLGYSLYYQAPVSSVTMQAMVRTIWIGLPALMGGILLGTLIGSIHALSAGKALGLLLDLLSAIALSLPTLVLGLGALLLAARTRWFPLGGMSAPTFTNPEFPVWLLDRLHHLTLPVICLAIPIVAYVERIQFASARGALEQQTVRSARSRGLGAARVMFNHLLRPSLNPVLSILGPLFGAALSGSLVIEVIFAWPGLGQTTYEALFNRDLFLLVGCVIATSLLLMTGGVAADFLCAVIDPRMRAPKGSAA
jgi:peptide/nickel transport system permease protein